MIGEDLVWDDVARDQAGQDSCNDHGALRRRAGIALVAAVAHDRHERGRGVLSARSAEISGKEPHELFEITYQGGVPVHLDTKVLEDGDARRGGDATGRVAHQRFLDATNP